VVPIATAADAANVTVADLTGLNEAGVPPNGAPRGLAALEAVDEVSIVAIPDVMIEREPPALHTTPPKRCDRFEDPPEPGTTEASPEVPVPHFTDEERRALQLAMVAHCERRKDRVAILDAPRRFGEPRVPALDVASWCDDLRSSYAALYFPWIVVADPLRGPGGVRAIPPSGHVAGIYARVDRRTGVHKPPANEVVERAVDLSRIVTESEHAALNDRAVNVLRAYPGRGIRVMGERTLFRDGEEWRYVNVRRLLAMIEEAIDEGTQWIVFEPNGRETWREADRVVRSFLDDLWRRGMLDGARAEDAYSVVCDPTTNVPAEVEAGRLLCRIGVQPPWPAEFVTVTIDKHQSSTAIQELVGRHDA
jgi:phage tail sheath protein FI